MRFQTSKTVRNGQVLVYGAWVEYQNSASNGATYGKLYNWYAVDDARGLCPSGWHVPTDDQFTVLTDILGGTQYAGEAMKSSPTDSPAWDGSNTSGFSGLAGGYRNTMGASAMKATAVISGRLRLTVHTLGTVYCMVVALKSFGTTTTVDTVFQFVAFGIKNAGLWGA